MDDLTKESELNSVPIETNMIQLLLTIAKEMKAPISFAVMVFLFVTEGWLAYDHVSKADLKDVHHEMELMSKSIDNVSTQFTLRLTGVQTQLAFDHLDNRKHAVRTEMFNLKQRLKETGKDDRMSEQRLDELEGEAQDIDRQLNNLHIVDSP